MKHTFLSKLIVTGCAAIALAAFGCAEPNEENNTAAAADSDHLDEAASINWTDSNGVTWTIEARTPIVSPNYMIRGAAMFTNPTGGGSILGGVCLLREYRTSTGAVRTCTSNSQCTGYPGNLAGVGGADGYCFKADNETVSKCWYRPGPRATYCGGSPANGQPISWGLYQTQDTQQLDTTIKWVSNACVLGCNVNGGGSDPSVSSSSSTSYIYNGTGGGGGGYKCQKCGTVCC